MQLTSINPYQQVSHLQQTSSNLAANAASTSVNQSSTDLFTLSPQGQAKMEMGKDIMSKYDVTNMSFNALEQMSDELRGAGLMTDQEYLMMNRPNNNMSSLSGLVKTDMNQPTNIISAFEEQLQQKKQLGFDSKFIAQDQKRLDTLKFFASL